MTRSIVILATLMLKYLFSDINITHIKMTHIDVAKMTIDRVIFKRVILMSLNKSCHF